MHQASSREAWREKWHFVLLLRFYAEPWHFSRLDSRCSCANHRQIQFGSWTLSVKPRTRETAATSSSTAKFTTFPKTKPRNFIPFRGRFQSIRHPRHFPVLSFSPTCPNIQFACRAAGSSMEFCHKPGLLNKLNYIGDVAYEWKDIEFKQSPFVVYNGEVLDLSVYLDQVAEDSDSKPLGNTLDRVLRENLGKDASRALSVYDQDTLDCLFEHFRAGLLDVKRWAAWLPTLSCTYPSW